MDSQNLKPYPTYTDSGVPWLGDVPEGWDLKPLKRWARMNAKVLSETTNPDYQFLYLDIGSVGTGTLTHKPKQIRFSAAPSRARRVVRQGDTIVSTVRTYLKAVYFVDEAIDMLVCSTGFAVLTPRIGTLPKFASYLAQSDSFTDQVSGNSVGIAYPAIAETRLGSLPVAIPPLPEQAAIVRYLDHMDRRIRRYIGVKQKLIKLLNEEKQVIIHRAVTRGLDHNVRLKPSGFDWLGEVPEGWDVRRTKNLFSLRTEKSGKRHNMELLSLYTHIGVRPRKELEERGNKASTTDDYWIVRRGDIIVNKLLAWMGAVGASEFEGVTSPAYDILRPRQDLVSEFYHLLLRTKLYLQQFKQRSRGIMDMRLRLYFDQLGQIPLLVPPLEEQRAIASFCINATADINRTIESAQRQIALLREYRARLIADIVTGKLDVREAAAALPDEADVADTTEAIDELMLEDASIAEHFEETLTGAEA